MEDAHTAMMKQSAAAAATVLVQRHLQSAIILAVEAKGPVYKLPLSRAAAAAMADEGDKSVKRSQSEPADVPGASTSAAASTSRNAGSSSNAGDSRRSSLNKSGTRTPRFDLVPMTEYFESSPATPNGADSDAEETLGWGSISNDSRDSPPASMTPTFNESYNSLKRNLSMKSLRELELKHFQRAAWRKKDEPRKRPRDLEQLLIYAATGGARVSVSPRV